MKCSSENSQAQVFTEIILESNVKFLRIKNNIILNISI